MNQRFDSLMLATGAFVMAGAGLVLWTSGWLQAGWLNADSSLVRGTLVLATLLMVGLPPAWANGLFVRQLRREKLALERMCNANYRELCDEPAAADEPAASDTVERVREALTLLARQLREAEDARAPLELRARRGVIEQERIQALLMSYPDPALVIDELGQVVWANAAAEKALDFDVAAGIRCRIAQWSGLLGKGCQPLLDVVADLQRRKPMSVRTCELEFSGPTGPKGNFRVTARNYAASLAGPGDTDAGPRGVVAVFQDISDQREAGRQRAEFVSAVSHEMKTPLTGIKAYVELLADGDVTDQALREEFLGVINSQADRLQRLIENLLNLARIESGVVKVNKEPASLNELLKDALDVLRPAAEQKQIELRADLSPMYLGALVDRDQMSQAAINLLSNAIKYTPEGGTVTLRSRTLDDRVQFDVEDTGVGISAEDCHRVFQKFYRVKSHSGMAPGSGLGLALVKSIVEEVHGGSLTLRSEVGRGSTFTITLPAAGTIRWKKRNEEAPCRGEDG